MAIGFIDKDFIEEGPFRAVFYAIQMDAPESLSNVKLWFAYPDGSGTYFLADGQQDTDQDGEVVYVFNGNTRSAQKLTSDGSLETKTVTDGQGNESEEPVDSILPPKRKYVAEVTFELDVAAVRAVGARGEILVRKSYSLV